jgi:hypothetical protein
MASADCQASAKAEAKANVECTPPSIALEYDFQASAQFQSEAEFEAFLNVFFEAYAELLAQGEALVQLRVAAEGMVAAVAGVTGSLQGQIEGAGAGDLVLAGQLSCGLEALPIASQLLTDALTSIGASASFVGEMSTSFAAG